MTLTRIGMTLLALSVIGCPSKKEDDSGKHGSGSAIGSAVGSSVGSSELGSGSNAVTGSDGGSGSNNSVTGAGSGSGSAAIVNDPLPGSHRTANCPSTIAHSSTKAELKGRAITLEIAADSKDDKDTIAEIQRRTEELLKDRAAKLAGVGSTSGHDQHGTHGGGIGICPVHVVEGASATWKREAKGVSITITPKDVAAAQTLKSDIDKRIVSAKDWVKLGHGGNGDGNGGGGGAGGGGGGGR